jgi:beta-lactamase superfamily II metal-dependent hydrolase
MMFEVEMLPAREGDCIWIRYGTKAAPKQILIDAGRAGTFSRDLRARLMALPKSQKTFELFVISHVDRDHIEGSMAMLEDTKLGVTFKDIWFNGYDHLKSAKLETFGAVQGERVTAALLKRKAKWNKAWKSKAVALRGKTFPKKALAGGMTLTLLSPDRQKLLELIPTWEKECQEAGIIPGKKARLKEIPGLEDFGAIDVETLATSKFDPDATKPNGTSIVLLAQYKGKRALLAADSHEDRLLASVKALGKGKRLPIDVYKVSHHGSDKNVSRALIEAMDCGTYLISTNGSYFKHPKAATLARILKFGTPNATIAFNYRSKFTDVWDAPALKTKYHYTTIYPAKKSNGTLVVRLAD